MGLINWFKDKRMGEIAYELKRLASEIEYLHQKMEMAQTNVNSLRGLINRRVGKEKLSEDENQMNMDEVMKAFGGIPIELQRGVNEQQRRDANN